MAAVDGDWEVTVKSPMGDQKSVLTINSNGDSFTGKMIPVPMPMTLDCTATVDGDSITGEVKAGAFGSMPVSGTRKA